MSNQQQLDHPENSYLNLLTRLLQDGAFKGDRTGTGTFSLFGEQLRFRMSDGFPLLTTKKVYWKGVVHELLWFISGDTNIKYLVENGVNIWNEWPYENYVKATQINDSFEDDKWMQHWDDGTTSMYTQAGFIEKIKDDPEFAARWGDLGPVYGKQWRAWEGKSSPVMNTDGKVQFYNYSIIDQLDIAIRTLIKNPDSRRIIVSAWNPTEIGMMALPPCHALFQFYTRVLDADEVAVQRKRYWKEKTGEDLTLEIYRSNRQEIDIAVPTRAISLQLYQRSADFFLGVPFNIASYALLLHLVAHQVNMIPETFVHTFGDVHLYANHIEQANTQLNRQPYVWPTIRINQPRGTDIRDIKFEDIELLDYTSHPGIHAPVAV